MRGLAELGLRAGRTRCEGALQSLRRESDEIAEPRCSRSSRAPPVPAWSPAGSAAPQIRQPRRYRPLAPALLRRKLAGDGSGDGMRGWEGWERMVPPACPHSGVATAQAGTASLPALASQATHCGPATTATTRGCSSPTPADDRRHHEMRLHQAGSRRSCHAAYEKYQPSQSRVGLAPASTASGTSTATPPIGYRKTCRSKEGRKGGRSKGWAAAGGGSAEHGCMASSSSGGGTAARRRGRAMPGTRSASVRH